MSVNKVILIGRVGKDPESRKLDSGTTIVNLTLATSENYKTKEGKKIESTEWHNLQAWGRLAEIIEGYVSKGQLLYVEGKIKTESWEKEGTKHYKTVILVNSLQMLESKKSEKSEVAQPSNNDIHEQTDDLPF